MYEKPGKEQIKSLKNLRNLAIIGGKYLPNIGDILSLGAFVGGLATDKPEILNLSIGGLIASEALRFFIGRSNKSYLELAEMMAHLYKSCFHAVATVENLAEKIEQETQRDSQEEDES